jgi:hypothetical protein
LIDVRVTLERQASTEAAYSFLFCKRRRSTVPFYPFATTGYDEPDFSPAHMKILLEECPEEVFLNHALNEKPLLNLLLSREHKSGNTYWENVNLVMIAATFGLYNKTNCTDDNLCCSMLFFKCIVVWDPFKDASMTILLSLSLILWSMFLSASHNNFACETIKDTLQFIL